MTRWLFSLTLIGTSVVANSVFVCRAADQSNDNQPTAVEKTDDLKPLNKNKTVLLDAKGKKLLLRSEVVMREGMLEMLVCLKQTKEHESLLSVDTTAQIVHAGLLALGAQPGTHVQWQPEFKAATGQQIDIFFNWTDEQGKLHRDPAQNWVRNATRRFYIEKLVNLPDTFLLPVDSDLKWDAKNKELLWYGHMSDAQRDAALKISKDPAFQKAIESFSKQSQIRKMEANWVFAGSYFMTDEKTGERFYQAESGDLICVANFASATLDLAASSSATNEELLYEAFTDNVPPVGTKVTIELIPVFKSPDEPNK